MTPDATSFEQVAPRRLWERSFQTFLGVAVLAVGMWVVDTTQDQTVALAVQTEKIRSLMDRIDKLTIRSFDRYTSSDAEKDFALRDAALARIAIRLTALEEVNYRDNRYLNE